MKTYGFEVKRIRCVLWQFLFFALCLYCLHHTDAWKHMAKEWVSCMIIPFYLVRMNRLKVKIISCFNNTTRAKEQEVAPCYSLG